MYIRFALIMIFEMSPDERSGIWIALVVFLYIWIIFHLEKKVQTLSPAFSNLPNYLTKITTKTDREEGKVCQYFCIWYCTAQCQAQPCSVCITLRCFCLMTAARGGTDCSGDGEQPSAAQQLQFGLDFGKSSRAFTHTQHTHTIGRQDIIYHLYSTSF